MRIGELPTPFKSVSFVEWSNIGLNGSVHYFSSCPCSISSPWQRRKRRSAISSEVDQLVVTGSNIPSDSPPWVPELIFGRKNVERCGADSLGDFFRNLPQNSGPTFTENQNDSLAPGAAAIALRGLSPDATLVLQNGRRLAPYPFAQSGITAFVDLNSIPLAAIRQIDILLDADSAIYGSDAIAGVVNVRFRKV